MTPEALLGLFLAEARGQSAWAWSSDAGEALATTQLVLAASAEVRGRIVLLAAEALAVAEKVGYPIMIKASEGGGGKGVRKATVEYIGKVPEIAPGFWIVPTAPLLSVRISSGNLRRRCRWSRMCIMKRRSLAAMEYSAVSASAEDCGTMETLRA